MRAFVGPSAYLFCHFQQVSRGLRRPGGHRRRAPGGIAGMDPSPLYIHHRFLLAFTSRPPVADGLGVTVVVAPNDWFGSRNEETRGEMDARRH